MWLWVSNCTDGDTVKQSTFGTGQGLLHSLNIYNTGPISLAQKCTSGETEAFYITFMPNIGKIGWKLREPIRFEVDNDGRTDGSVWEKLCWYVSSGANKTKTAHRVVWRSPYLSTVIMTSWHGKAFCITGLFNWEYNGHRWILHTKGRVYPKYSHTKNPYHDDVIKWKHFPRYWPFVRGIHRSPVNSPHKSQWRGALMFSLICAWINSWVNSPEASDLRCNHDHYDATVMSSSRGWGTGSFSEFLVGSISWGLFHWWFFHRNSFAMEISFCSFPNCSEVMAMKFCTWHDSCAVVTCAKFCSNMIAQSRVTLKPVSHQIWITMEKPLVKWAPGFVWSPYQGWFYVCTQPMRDVVTK